MFRTLLGLVMASPPVVALRDVNGAGEAADGGGNGGDDGAVS